MNKIRIIITTLVLFFLLLLFYSLLSSNWFSSEQYAQPTQHHIESEKELSTSHTLQPLSDNSQGSSNTEMFVKQDASVRMSADKMNYDSEWCLAEKDLNEKDIAYYHRELEDWNLSRGHISPPSPNGYVSDKSQYLVPYMESSFEELSKQIEVGNEYAMIAALGRFDVDFENQRSIALKLVVKGHTGAALSHLVLIELSNSEMIYKKTGIISADIKESINKAMGYVAYGTQQVDLSALSTYLLTVSSPDFPSELKYFLSKDNNINKYTLTLEAYINKSRFDENVDLATPDRKPKAVKHDFENTLAYLYREYGSEINHLKTILPETIGSKLNVSECVQKKIEFINSLERGRKSSPGTK